ncbi:MAG: carboxypeptidase regulatory-like domain-containing protein [Proteobacteria bacterium]|nr:carboxypeptidase regulatory-like domain-containing protein [Pseudomonadota bacterium]
MYKILLQINLFLLLSIFISCGGGSSGTGGYGLNGKVVTPANVPISNTEVDVLDLQGNLIASTSSNADGTYEFGTLTLKEFLIVVDGEEFYVKIPDDISLVSINITVSEEFIDFEIVYDEFVTDDDSDSDPGDDIIIESNDGFTSEQTEN